MQETLLGHIILGKFNVTNHAINTIYNVQFSENEESEEMRLENLLKKFWEIDENLSRKSVIKLTSTLSQ